MQTLNHEILREVGMLARAIQSLSDLKHRGLSLQRGQFVFLTRICEHPGINLVDLSYLLKVDKGTTTKAIQKLSAEGYVRRERGQEDKRMWYLFPLAKAEGIYPLLIEEENRFIDICFSGFSPDEQDAVLELMQRMRKNMEQEWKSIRSGNGE